METQAGPFSSFLVFVRCLAVVFFQRPFRRFSFGNPSFFTSLPFSCRVLPYPTKVTGLASPSSLVSSPTSLYFVFLLDWLVFFIPFSSPSTPKTLTCFFLFYLFPMTCNTIPPHLSPFFKVPLMFGFFTPLFILPPNGCSLSPHSGHSFTPVTSSWVLLSPPRSPLSLIVSFLTQSHHFVDRVTFIINGLACSPQSCLLLTVGFPR